jgi:hypothetical protein
MMILSFSQTPLPAPDFHNVRHHDGPGEVCEHHDHLLRWHPNAGQSEDVAILHWHWFLPTPGTPDRATPPDGPAMHAHVADAFAPTWNDGPQLTSEEPCRLLDRLADQGPSILTPPPLDRGWPAMASRAGPCSVRAFSATFAPQTQITSLLVRWTC